MVVTRALALSLLVLAAAAALGASLPAGAGATTTTTRATTEVVVRLGGPSLAYVHTRAARKRLDTQQRRFVAVLHRTLPRATVRWRYRTVANGFAVSLPPTDVARLRTLPGVTAVYGGGTRYHALAGPDAATIDAQALPSPPTATTGEGIKIGIIDDGVDQTHPFFDPTSYTMPAGFPKGQTAYTTAKVIVARAFPPPGTTWRYADRPFDPEQSGHATHVAGIAAGNANTLAQGARISGIAPRAYIGNYKALTVPTDADVGLDGNAPEIVAAIDAAVRDGMDVINLSIGEPEIAPQHDVVALALDGAAAAGVVPVVAAGNDYTEFGAGSLTSPGSAADAITVGATTSGTAPTIASFSSSGPTPVSLRLKPDVVAPGSSILSSEPGGWGELSGTSMATPHVAGAAALLLQRHPDWTPLQVKAALTVTARPVRNGTANVAPTRSGAGLVDVAAADTPLVHPTPTAVSFGLVRPGSSLHREIALDDAGGGAGTWAVGYETAQAPAGARVALPTQIAVPGTLTVELAAGAAEGELGGIVVLRRNGIARRIPIWGRVAAPHLAHGRRPHARPHRGLRGGHARPRVPCRPVQVPGPARRRDRVEPSRRARAGVPRRAPQAGREPRRRDHVARSGSPRAAAHRGRRRREPAHGLCRSTAEPQPLHVGVRGSHSGRRCDLAGARHVRDRLRQPDEGGSRRVPVPLLDQRYDAPDGEADGARRACRASADGAGGGRRLGRRSALARRDDRRQVDHRGAPRRPGPRVDRGVAPGTHRLRLRLSDYQETRNMENVARILPNTRVVVTSVRIRPAA